MIPYNYESEGSSISTVVELYLVALDHVTLAMYLSFLHFVCITALTVVLPALDPQQQV